MDLQTTKSMLKERLAEKTQHLEKITKSLRAQHSASFSEQAIERESDEVKEQLEGSISNEILLIKSALDRIGAGTYEYCSNCGNEIASARLEALPYTSLCIDCADG